MWTRPFAAALLVVLVAACGSEPSSYPPHRSTAQALVELLADPDPEVRGRAAADLARLEDPPRAVIDALLRAQHDDDEAVSAAAVEALDRIQPPADVAERIQAHGSFQTIGQVLVAPAHLRWRRVDCEEVALEESEALEGCWLLARIPAVYETRIKHFDPLPGHAQPETGQPGPHIWRSVGRRHPAGDLDSSLPPGQAPEGVPDSAKPGEVWCQIASPRGRAWRRVPACEMAATPR